MPLLGARTGPSFIPLWSLPRAERETCMAPRSTSEARAKMVCCGWGVWVVGGERVELGVTRSGVNRDFFVVVGHWSFTGRPKRRITSTYQRDHAVEDGGVADLAREHVEGPLAQHGVNGGPQRLEDEALLSVGGLMVGGVCVLSVRETTVCTSPRGQPSSRPTPDHNHSIPFTDLEAKDVEIVPRGDPLPQIAQRRQVVHVPHCVLCWVGFGVGEQGTRRGGRLRSIDKHARTPSRRTHTFP